jgi:cyclophilin family peptidyl-prolyl cis-trans isomerase
MTHHKPTKAAVMRRRRAARKANSILLSALGILIFLGVIWLAMTGQEKEKNAAGAMQWNSQPPMTIDVAKQYYATVKLEKGGEFVIQLYPDKAPLTVNNFVFLAREGYYDGVTFHRVLAGFMAQTGDPTGTGAGSPGYTFVNEDSDLTFDQAGVVAMANAGRDTNGSQFFITFAPQPSLDGGYTIFGQVVEGMDVVNGITLRDPRDNPTFTGDVIESIVIEEK